MKSGISTILPVIIACVFLVYTTPAYAVICYTSHGETHSFPGMTSEEAIAYTESTTWNTFTKLGPNYYSQSNPNRSGTVRCVEDEAATTKQSSSTVSSNIVRTEVLTTAKPATQKDSSSSDSSQTKNEDTNSTTLSNLNQEVGTDLFINFWKANEISGKTYGINPSYSFGEKHAVTLTLPVYVISPDDFDGYKTVGLDTSYRFNWTETIAVGAHANYLGIFGSGSIEDSSVAAAGVYLSYLWQITDAVGLSLGMLMEATFPEDGNENQQIIPGINLGIMFSERWVANIYSVMFQRLDNNDCNDDFYSDIGAEISYANQNWDLQFGMKTTQGLNDYEAVEIYLGSNWRF